MLRLEWTLASRRAAAPRRAGRKAVSAPLPRALTACALVLLLSAAAACSDEPQPAAPPPPSALPAAPRGVSQPTQEVPSPPVSLAVFTSEPPATVNLRPESPEGWNAPLILAGSPDAHHTSFVGLANRTYVSWTIANDGPEDVEDRFFIDLEIDGVPVERWTTEQGKQGDALTMTDWIGLSGRAGLTPGEHTLTLVVDPTNLIRETDEDDNAYNLSFTWPRPVGTGNGATVAPARLPNLAPFTPEGWDTPIKLGPLPSERLGIQIAYRNGGLSSASQFFLAHLYLNDVLVAKYSERGLIAQQGVITPSWEELTRVVHLEPGRHKLTLVVDPTHRILEANEEDNTSFLMFDWPPGLPGTTQTAPASLFAPSVSLDAFTPPGWDGALVAVNSPGDLVTPAKLLPTEPLYVHWAVKNSGNAGTPEAFAIDLLVDGDRVASWPRSRLEPGQMDFVVGWRLGAAAGLSPGPHDLALVLRPLPPGPGDRSDLLASRQIVIGDRVPESLPIRNYTAEELSRQLSGLERLLSSSAHSLDSGESPVSARDVLEVADGIYYGLNQRSLADEPVTIHLLDQGQYAQWVAVECKDTLRQLPDSIHEPYEQNCKRLEGFSGFTTNWRGQHRIVVRSDRPPMQLLAALAHELGHFHQSVDSPELNAFPPFLDFRALQEAQAYAYQTYYFKDLELMTGRDLLLYPKLEGYEQFIEERIDTLVRDVDVSEHARGRLLVWLAVLTDPELRSIRNVLLTQRALTAEAALELYTYLLNIPPQDVIPYVNERMKSLKLQTPAIKDLATARLLAGLPYWNEGSPYLREVGLLLP